MPARDLFDLAARARVKQAVERIESQTSAEVVVTVRRRTGRYRDIDLALGALAAFAALLALLFADHEFSTLFIPLDVAIAFALGAVLSARAPLLHRTLVSRARRRESARKAACEAFVAQRIGRTSGRTGILVLVAVYEREVAVVFDVGIDASRLGPAFEQAVRTLERSIARTSPTLEAFVEALEALGPALAPTLPRQADDVNELPDDAEVA